MGVGSGVGFELFVGRAACRYQEGSEKYISQFHCRLLSEELLEVNKIERINVKWLEAVFKLSTQTGR